MLRLRFECELYMCLRTCRQGLVTYPLASYYYLAVWLVLNLEFRICQLFGDPDGGPARSLINTQRDKRDIYTPSMQTQAVSSTSHFGLSVCQSHKYDNLILHPLESMIKKKGDKASAKRGSLPHLRSLHGQALSTVH